MAVAAHISLVDIHVYSDCGMVHPFSGCETGSLGIEDARLRHTVLRIFCFLYRV